MVLLRWTNPLDKEWFWEDELSHSSNACQNPHDGDAVVCVAVVCVAVVCVAIVCVAVGSDDVSSPTVLVSLGFYTRLVQTRRIYLDIWNTNLTLSQPGHTGRRKCVLAFAQKSWLTSKFENTKFVTIYTPIMYLCEYGVATISRLLD